MNLIIPMAGKGKRLRPHTLTVPKPLIPVAGKPIVQRLVEDIAKVTPERIKKIGFVIKDLEEDILVQLKKIAESVGAEAKFYTQETAEGTAHAIACANEILEKKVTIAFSDTLFRADFKLNSQDDAIIKGSRIGPNVSIGEACEILNSTITDSLIQNNTTLNNVDFSNSMIGNYVKLKGQPKSVSLGDYCEW